MRRLLKSMTLAVLFFSTHASACIHFGPGPMDKDSGTKEDIHFGPGPMDEEPQSEGDIHFGPGPMDEDEDDGQIHFGPGPEA